MERVMETKADDEGKVEEERNADQGWKKGMREE